MRTRAAVGRWWPLWAAGCLALALAWGWRHPLWGGLAAACCTVTAGLLAATLFAPSGPGTRVGRLAGFPWTPVRLTTDERLRHVHCLGPSGSGKTTSVLTPLLAQDVAAGHGITVIEIKGGDLCRHARAAAARAGRTVLTWDPGAAGGMGWNPLADPSPATAERLVYALQRTGGPPAPASDYYAAVGAAVVRHAVGAFASAGLPLDLLGLRGFLVDPQARQRVLREADDPFVREYFLTVFEAWRPDERLRNVQGLLNHLDSLLVHAPVRQALCPEPDAPTLDLGRCLSDGEILLVTLPIGGMLRLAEVLGHLLLSALQANVYARPAATPCHFIYLDEFQHFAGPGFAEFLALCRGFGVGTVLAHQNLGQLRALGGPALAETVLANTRTTVILRCDAPDAAPLASRLPARQGSRPWETRELATLAFGQAILARSGRRGRPSAGRVRLSYAGAEAGATVGKGHLP